jgi:hypothetical protein
MSRAQLAVVIFLLAFAVYVLTAPRVLRAYEPETAGVTEGLVRTGDFKILRGSPLVTAGGVAGKDGKLVGRVGLPQPLAEAPFYAAGWLADTAADSGYRYRTKVLLTFNGFVLALTAALVFLICRHLPVSTPWSIAVALAFAFASLAWPYSKVGAESMVTLGVALTLLGALIARRSANLWPWALVGAGAGMAVAAKQYSLPAVAAMGLLLYPALKAEPAKRLARLLAVAGPFLVWVAGMAYYNWARTGSVLETGNTEYQTTWAAPLNAIGFLVSPGKGLVWYSPLVIVGALGLVALWRKDRRLALTLGLVFALGVLVASLVPHWTDETWGPRYLMPVAWLPLLAIPFWATSAARVRVVAALATIAVLVQLVAVLVPFTQVIQSTQSLTGQPLFEERDQPVKTAALGRDSVRWVPQLSPLLVQSTLVASRAATGVGLPPITLNYHPYEGPQHRLTLSKEFATQVGFERPDFWWIQAGAGKAGLLAALLAAVVAALAGRALWRARQSPA